MKIFLINGSPRKEWNTGTLLGNALEGARSNGAEAELVHLYDLNYQGCNSCFGCKEKDGVSYGRCAVEDDLRPLLARIEKEAGALVLGSPIYLGTVTGQMQAFLERLVFPFLTYTDPPATLFPRRIPTAFIYTMGVTEEQMREIGYLERFATIERFLARIFGPCERLMSFDCYQFEDYSRVVAPRFDPAHKLKRRREVFPLDCQKAFDLGAAFARAVKESSRP